MTERESSLVLFAADRKEVILLKEKLESNDLNEAFTRLFKALIKSKPRLAEAACAHVLIDIHAHGGEIQDVEILALRLASQGEES